MRAQFEIGFDDVDFARVLYYARYYSFVERGFAAWLHGHQIYHRVLYHDLHVALPIVTSCLVYCVVCAM